MDIQTLNARRVAAEAKKRGALEANLCREHGPDLVVHVVMPNGEERSEIVHACGCTDTEVHKLAESHGRHLQEHSITPRGDRKQTER